MHTFQSEIHKTADFLSNLLVSWELMTEGFERPLPDMEILWFVPFKHCQFYNRPLRFFV